MKTINLAVENKEEVLNGVVNILRAGGIIICPTDTVYGIFGNATNESSIKKIFKIKKRSEEKAFPIFVKNEKQARQFAFISDAKIKLLLRVWPGAVTAIFRHKKKLPPLLTGGFSTIGIRVPDDSFLLELLSRIDFPLVQTSANISNKPAAQTVDEIRSYFGESDVQPDLVIDGGTITTQHSTVLDCIGNIPTISRTGALSKKELDVILQGLQ